MGKLIFDSNRRVDSTKGEEADVGVMFGNKDTSGMSVILGEVMNGHVVLFGQKQPQVYVSDLLIILRALDEC